jgi:iduronate 2-sulfatase
MKFICAAAILACTGIAIAAKTPNVVFIAVDDLRPELRCYGQAHIHSPNIDRLAASGVLFEHAYCQYPVCNASRASLLTGLRPDSTRVYDNFQDFRKHVPDVITLPQHFQSHGYVTRAFGKIFHSSFDKAYVGRAFDDPPSWTTQPWYGSPQYYFTSHGIEVARDIYGKKNRKSGAELDGWTTEFVQGLATEAPNVPDSALYDGQVTDRAIQALGELKEQKFFLAVGYLRPHLPFVAPKKYWDLYDRASISLPTPATAPKNAPAAAMQRNVELRVQYIDMRNEQLNEAQQRELRHGYYACVSYVDSLIGRLIGELDRLGLRENTIIVLWGDHGYHLGEQECWGKLTAFEMAARVPLIVSAPGRKAAGAKSSALVELVDVYPSLCGLADLPLPPHLEGQSFVPLLEEPNRPWKAGAFTQVVHGTASGRSLRTRRYRITRWQQTKSSTETMAMELYDYRQASTETENIAERPENTALVKELSAKLQAGWPAARPKSNDQTRD